MPDIEKYSGVEMADIEKISGHDVPSGGSATVTTKPTGSISFGFGLGTITISNHSSYTNPNYSVSISIGGTEIVADADINHEMNTGDDSLGAIMTFSDTNTSTSQRTVTIKAQEFGDNIQSEALTLTYTPTFAAYRYIRVTNTNASKGTSGTSWLAIRDWSLYDGAGQTGIEYPTTNLISDTSETGIALTSSTVYSSNSKYKAFDSSGSTRFWGISGSNKFLQIEFEPATYSTPPTIKSMNLNVLYAFHLLFEGSNDGVNYTEMAHVGPMSTSSSNGSNSNLNVG